tara:strand:+ start:31 stop:936 length:906 start_codon:yes stop_codon:yes gene_type:complete
MSINTSEEDAKYARQQGLLNAGPKTKLQPIGNTSYGFLGPSAASPASPTGLLENNKFADTDELAQAARLIGSDPIKGKSKGVPSSWLIEHLIKPMAYHESERSMDPQKKQNKGGPGRGLMQFEHPMKYTNSKGIELQGGFGTAVNRARRYFNKTLDKPVPQWLSNIKKSDDATVLTGPQQMALALYNFRELPPKKHSYNIQKAYNDFKKGNGRAAITKFWKLNHHIGKPKEKAKTFNDRIESFNKDYTLFTRSPLELGDTDYGPKMTPRPTSPPRPNPRRKPNPNLGNAYLKQNKIAAFRR